MALMHGEQYTLVWKMFDAHSERPVNGLVGLKWKETRMLFGKEATVEKWITEAKENTFYTMRAEQDGFVFITTNRVSGIDGAVTLTGIHETQTQGFAAKVKALPMVFFKGDQEGDHAGLAGYQDLG